MQKIKSLNFSSFLSILKCCLLGIITTLVGAVIFAAILKLVDLPSEVISYVNDAIKAFSIFVVMVCIKKSHDGKLMIKSVFVGMVYELLSFVIFSIMDGGFIFDLKLLYDLLFAVVVAVIVSIIVNLTFKRKV